MNAEDIGSWRRPELTLVVRNCRASSSAAARRPELPLVVRHCRSSSGN
jgi:hypothetical protein